MEIFGARLRERVNITCAKWEITQEELAERCGLGRTRLRNYFDRNSSPPMNVLLKLADETETDINWLLGRPNTTPEWPKEDPLAALNRKMDALIDKT